MPRALPLALCAHEGPVTPCGLVVARAGAAAFLMQIEMRLAHYRGLKLAAGPQHLVFIVPEGEALPWHEATMFYLWRQGPAFLPVGWRLGVPARWNDVMIERLAREKEASLPLLFLPGATAGRLSILSLASACPAGDIDLPRLAGTCLP